MERKLTSLGAGRFAPTPTGRLHLGNVRTALLAWLWARSCGLRNLLRIEDLDPAAIPQGLLDGLYQDLDWLGLHYDESPLTPGEVGPYRQSERSVVYQAPLLRLAALGVLYPCWCSRKEVASAAVAPHFSDEGPIYPKTCRNRTPEPLCVLDITNLPVVNGRFPALRIDVGSALNLLGINAIEFVDVVQGPQRFVLTETMGDFVVRRSDGIVAYQLACAYDDVMMGCTQVLRGRDLLPSTARQILLLRLLELPVPTYAHVGLALNCNGDRLSKRDGSTSIQVLRERGSSSYDVLTCLGLSVGWSTTGKLDDLASRFRINEVTPHDVTVPLPGANKDK
ncbi:MAG: tRNA glutamyl-Q(34) synthetase GluQRS [Myxococcales bacterium]|nr:tRNA glutamyl-Q(34) synthetase GluQRS [Myxococcales bacterium]